MSTRDIFDNLVTDITAQVLQQVQEQLQSIVVGAVNQRVEGLINSNHINNTIDDRINRAVTEYKPDTTAIDQTMKTVIAQMGETVSGEMNDRIGSMITERINGIDFVTLISNRLDSKLDRGTAFSFPEKSIDLRSVNMDSLMITGDNIVGGVIKNFGSIGIDDQATGCKVTILDQGTIFENTLYTPRIEVKGGALIDGDLEIQGNIVNNAAYQQIVSDAAATARNSITDTVLTEHQNLIFERIQNEGVDLSRVTFNGRTLVDGDRLVGVINSQLRTVGTLQDLQTSGETLLSETLYANSNRVGINTMDPKSALSIWDEEIEIGIGKSQKGVGRIATERDSDLILGTNNKDNITLKSDGSVAIPMLQINNMMFTSSSTPPTYSANRGTVVFNEVPSLGGPLGWVSLGDARWANFGIVD